jgi:lipopolysaccharide/colanic/teichoic acid biosynthesis glycosyltransferase
MRASGSGPAITVAGDRRVTCVGAILRKFKLDELPQFINVLKGDMSMVGPRPEVPEFVEPGNRLWDQVLMVRPGITDLATLLYRNEEQLLASSAQPELHYHRTILPAKLALNIEYMRSRSLRRDIRLLLLTAWYSLRPGRFHGHQVETLLRG